MPKKRVLITKIKNEKGEVITSRKGTANLFGEFYKKYTTTKNTKKLIKKNEESENESSIDCAKQRHE